MSVSISKGNSKLGTIPSISLPAYLTCSDDVPCKKKCYAGRYMKRRSNVRMAYSKNYSILQKDPVEYWREIEASMMMSRFFRFHVAGDIPNERYLDDMARHVRKNKHCRALCFTKKYDIVNNYLDHHRIPKNLILVFSVWPGYAYKNPHNLPTAHIRFRDGTTTAPKNAFPCGGSCEQCAMAEKGCWVLKHGQSVELKEH